MVHQKLIECNGNISTHAASVKELIDLIEAEEDQLAAEEEAENDQYDFQSDMDEDELPVEEQDGQ